MCIYILSTRKLLACRKLCIRARAFFLGHVQGIFSNHYDWWKSWNFGAIFTQFFSNFINFHLHNVHLPFPLFAKNEFFSFFSKTNMFKIKEKLTSATFSMTKLNYPYHISHNYPYHYPYYFILFLQTNRIMSVQKLKTKRIYLLEMKQRFIRSFTS